MSIIISKSYPLSVMNSMRFSLPVQKTFNLGLQSVWAGLPAGVGPVLFMLISYFNILEVGQPSVCDIKLLFLFLLILLLLTIDITRKGRDCLKQNKQILYTTK